MKGKLIVLDGPDGVGKTVQTKLLTAHLKHAGVPVRTLDFPQYKKNFFGSLIGEALLGGHGDFIHLDPHIASVLYAADRFESKSKIETWLKEGAVVILNRYVSSNQIHQAGKINNAKKREKFLRWLDRMEYGVFGLPRPDVTIYFNLPTNLSLQLLRAKRKETYVKKLRNGKKDQAESSLSYLAAARDGAVTMLARSSRWKRVDCWEGDTILPPDVIHHKVWQIVARQFKTIKRKN